MTLKSDRDLRVDTRSVSAHAFHIGTDVLFSPDFMPPTLCTVVTQLPSGGEGVQYRIRNKNSSQEWVTTEARLKSAK